MTHSSYRTIAALFLLSLLNGCNGKSESPSNPSESDADQLPSDGYASYELGDSKVEISNASTIKFVPGKIEAIASGRPCSTSKVEEITGLTLRIYHLDAILQEDVKLASLFLTLDSKPIKEQIYKSAEKENEGDLKIGAYSTPSSRISWADQGVELSGTVDLKEFTYTSDSENHAILKFEITSKLGKLNGSLDLKKLKYSGACPQY
jgi:hypothetical protein